MIGSLLLLLSFLIFWNIENYKREKADLQKELAYQGELAESAIQQNVLWKMVERYSDQNDTVRIVSHIAEFGDDFDELKSKLPNWLNNDSLDIIEGMDSLSITYFNTNQPTSYGFSTDQKFSITTEEPKDFEYFLTAQSTENVGTELEKRLATTKLPREFDLKEFKDDGSDPVGLRVEFHKNKQSASTAVFKNYNSYLFKKLWPSILATIVLFIIVALAFYSLYNSRRQQMQLNTIKSEFVSNMTHELKTPISTVSVALEAISNFGAMEDPARMKEYLDISRHELNRLGLIVDKVLKMSAFDKGAAKLSFEKLDLLQIINDILKTMQLHFEQKGVKLNLTIKGTHFEMQGDRIHLTNVIYNLIDNALKYSPENPRIDVLLEEASDQYKVSVRDQGIGIPPAYIDKIFNPFFRVPSDDTHDVKGHGLGLSYVKQIIENHGGQIAVASDLQLGSQFKITLPSQTAYA